MKKLLSLSLLLSSLFFWTACSTFNKPPVSKVPPKAADEISFMSFNVENLFDTKHDADHDDSTFLPLSAKQTVEHREQCSHISNPFYRNECFTLDWNDDVLNVKLKNLSQVILGVDGNGPDMLIILEIENKNVLDLLNKNYLAKANYQTAVLIPSADKRGITVGFLSRFPVIGTPVLHPIPFQPKLEKDREYAKETRGILEVTVKTPDGDPLTIFGAHFPSQASPHEWRDQAAHYMSKLIADKGAKAMVIGGGDLNITAEEDDEYHMFKNIFSQNGAEVSHLVGCQDCPGSHHYRKTWSFLDAQIYSKALTPEGSGSYELEPQTIDVIRYNPIHLYKGKYPKRFDPENREGVSDHFPLYSRFKKRAQ